MIKKRKWMFIALLALCGLLCFVLAACGDGKPAAASIGLSEEFEDGRVFEYGGVIKLPYGIALDEDGNGVSYEVENIVADRSGKEIARSDYGEFELEVGDYIARYEYGDLVLEREFSVKDTTKPVIVFSETTTGDLYGEEGEYGSAILPMYEVEDYSVCETVAKLSFQPDDGAFIENYPYNKLVESFEAEEPGTFTYTVTATDASGNVGTATLTWRAKDRNWAPAKEPGGTFVSDFGEESYLDSLWNGDFSDTYESNGNFFGSWLESYEGAEGVLKAEVGFNSNNSASIRFKLAKPIHLGDNEKSGKYLVVRMYLDNADAIGSLIYVAGNTRSDHTWDGGQTIRYNEVLTRSMTEADGIVSGEWFNLYIPVSLLIEMQCSSGIVFDTSNGLTSSSYPILNNTNRGWMEFFQIGFSRMENVDSVSLYIDSIAFAEELGKAEGFTADYDEKTISWNAVPNAQAYAVYDENGTRVAIVDEPKFDASLLGAFTQFSVQPLGEGAYKDPDPVVVTAEELNLRIEEDGTWEKANFFKAVSAAYDGELLQVTLNGALGEGEADFSAFKLYAGDTEAVGAEVTLSGDRTQLIFDVSAWSTEAGAYEQASVFIPARSVITVGSETYTLIGEIRFAYVFGEWRYVSETEIGNVGTNNGYAANNNLMLQFYDTDGERIFGKTANEQYSFYADPARRTLDYSGSFTICGQELSDMLREFDAELLRLFARETDLHYMIFYKDTVNWQWMDLAAMCEKSGYPTVVVTIAAGTRLYFKTDSGEVDCFYFPDGYTFTKNGIDGEGSYGYIVEKGTPQSVGTRYTVTYTVDGSEYAHNIVFGGNIALRPADPVKANSGGYSYTFAGWYNGDAAWDFTAPVTANVTLTAKFTQTELAKYTVTFKNYDGTVLQTEELTEGSMPEYTGETPQRAGAEGVAYEFIGWSPAIAAVTGDAEYTATYKTLYTIRFVNWDGTLIQEYILEEGAAVAPPSDPTRPADEQYSYTFDGWSPEVSATATAPATYTATYKSLPNEYTVTFVNEAGGGVLDTVDLAYGGTVDLTQTEIDVPASGGVLFFLDGQPWDAQTPVTEDIEVTVRLISVTKTQADAVIGSPLDLNAAFCGGLEGAVWSVAEGTAYATVTGAALTPVHVGIVTVQGKVGSAEAFTVTVYVKDDTVKIFDERTIVGIGATTGNDQNFIFRLQDENGTLEHTGTATYEFSAGKFWYDGSIKFCGLELASLVGEGAPYKDVRFVYTPSGFRLDVQAQDGTWQTSLNPANAAAKLVPINGFHNAVIEFEEGTRLYIKLDAGTVLAAGFAQTFCYEWNTGTYEVCDVTEINGIAGNSNFFIKISDADGEITHPATFDNAYLGSGFSYTGSIKVCGIELRDLATLVPERFSPDASGWFARFIYVADNGYRLDLYDAGRAAGASFWGAWEPFNGYSKATVEFAAGTVLYIKNGANSKMLRFHEAMYLEKGGSGNVFTEYTVTSIPAYEGNQWGQYNFDFATDEGVIPVYKNNTTVRTYDLGAGFTYEGSIKVCGVELSELIGQHGVTGVRLAGYTDGYALQLQGADGWAYLGTLMSSMSDTNIVFAEGTVLTIRAGEDSKILHFAHTFTVTKQNGAADIS